MAKNWLQDSVGFSSIIILLVYLTYSNSLEGSFVWDDRAAIVSFVDKFLLYFYNGYHLGIFFICVVIDRQ